MEKRENVFPLFDTKHFLFNKLNYAEKNYISTIITNPEALKIYTNDKYNNIYENIMIKRFAKTYYTYPIHNEYEVFPSFKYDLNEEISNIDTYPIYNYFMELIDDITYKEYIKEQIPTLKDELKIKTNPNKESYEIIIKNIINENINKLKLLLNSNNIIDYYEFSTIIYIISKSKYYCFKDRGEDPGDSIRNTNDLIIHLLNFRDDSQLIIIDKLILT